MIVGVGMREITAETKLDKLMYVKEVLPRQCSMLFQGNRLPRRFAAQIPVDRFVNGERIRCSRRTYLQ